MLILKIYFYRMQDKLTQNIKDIVSEQVKQGFKSHAAVIEEGVINAVRSRAVTPSPNVDSHVSFIIPLWIDIYIYTSFI